MIDVLKSEDRGRASRGWLEGRHTFSAANPNERRPNGYGALFSIAEDRIAPGGGFPMHPHRDMEIVSYVLSGALAHKDSLGNGSVIRPGEIQRMSAGAGVVHSEFNPSDTETYHGLQIWILPAERGIAPSYEQKPLPAPPEGGLILIGAPDAPDGGVTLHQDVALYRADVPDGGTLVHSLAVGRRAWVQITRGRVLLNGTTLDHGDGAAIQGEAAVTLRADGAKAEALLFDLA